MVTIKLLVEDVNEDRKLAKWLNMANGDIGELVDFALLADNTVTIHGTFGVNGTVIIQGSNDGVNWFTLTETDHVTPCSYTIAIMALLLERPRYIRPNVTNGDGSTAIDVYLMLR